MGRASINIPIRKKETDSEKETDSHSPGYLLRDRTAAKHGSRNE